MAEEKVPQTKNKQAELEAELAKLKADLASAEAAKLKAEENAVEGVCKALGINPSALEEAAKAQENKKKMMEYDIYPMVVSINGNEYSGRGVAPAEVVEVIMHMAGAKRMRELKAKVGNNYEIIQLAGGQISSRMVGQVEG